MASADPHYAGPPLADGERRGADRRASEGRRSEDRRRRLREAIATVLALCGGLSVIYFVFAALGAVDLADAAVGSIVALVLGAAWLAGVWQRSRTGGAIATRPDRERRGF